MASTDNEVPQPIIVKKVKKGGGGHHGGAWKVAYADFVTAMMAFFLLMWLLNVTTEEQKNAISNYFDPTHPRVSSELSGSGGILGGLSMAPDGAQVSNVQDVAVPARPTTPRSGMALGKQRDQLGTSEYEGDTYQAEIESNRRMEAETGADETDVGNMLRDGVNILEEVENLNEEELEQLQAFVEAEQNADFEAIKQEVMDEIGNSPELADLMDQLMIDITPEGLRIQIVDKEGRSMFPSGSATMLPFMKQLVGKVTQVITPQPNQISVRGHTDGTQYPPNATYNNWNLSSDRALASRNAMTEAGLSPERVENVMGKADREHLLPEDPLSPRNRRISIILLREKMANAEEIRNAAARAVQKNREEQAEIIRQQQLEQEDREDIDALDQRVEGQSGVTIDDESPLTEAVGEFDTPADDYSLENTTGNMVGDEIDKIRQRNESSIRYVPALPAPEDNNNPNSQSKQQVLTFP